MWGRAVVARKALTVLKDRNDIRTKMFFIKIVRFYYYKVFINMERYNKDELEKLILEQNKSYSTIGKQYGVSGAAIKKAAKKLGIPIPRRRTVNEKENFSHCGKRKQNSLVNSLTDEDFCKIIQTSNTWKTIGEKLGYKSRVLSSNVKDSIMERCSKLGMEVNLKHIESVLDKTKGELFSTLKNWQTARTSIRKSAVAIFKENNPSPKCAVCGYQNHVEVAHIKAVAAFDDNTTIREINSIDNLIGLCPNHHWEYDNGILEL